MKASALRFGTSVALAVLLAAPTALAGPKGGGGSRGDAKASVNKPAPKGGNDNKGKAANAAQNKNTNVAQNKNTNVNQNKNTNINSNKNVNVNSNRNRDVDVDIDVNHRGGYYDNDCCFNPIGTALAVTTAAVVTAAVVGSVVNTVPPGCTTTIINGLAYQQCGSTWYQPQYQGSNVTYIVVNQP
jgi:hypothetical protein